VIPIYWTACPVCRVEWEVHDGIVCARIADLEAEIAALRSVLGDMGVEHGCTPGVTPEEDRELMCSVCQRALSLIEDTEARGES
jgi:hypothetical protein